MSNMQNIPDKPLIDHLGRTVSYLRVSITDRCNLSCLYCQGEKKREYIPHERILRYEEFQRIVRISHKLGVKKIRITGGEPLMRRDCIKFLLALRNEFPDLHLAMTTNGILLKPYINDLANIKPDSINVSVDSFDAPTYKFMTGQDCIGLVMENIKSLLSSGVKVKINAVALKGVTDNQIIDFLNVATQLPVDIRFIEFMPMGAHTRWDQKVFLSSNDLLGLAKSHVKLEAEERGGNSYQGPAAMWKLTEGKGRVGFISAISNHFCRKCNRLRITSDGKLRACLFADKEYKLADVLRSKNGSDAEIENIFRLALQEKPLGSDILAQKKKRAVADGEMGAIGG